MGCPVTLAPDFSGCPNAFENAPKPINAKRTAEMSVIRPTKTRKLKSAVDADLFFMYGSELKTRNIRRS